MALTRLKYCKKLHLTLNLLRKESKDGKQFCCVSKRFVNFENSCVTPMLQVYRFLIRLNKLIIPNYLFKNIIFAFWFGIYQVLPQWGYFVIKSWKAFVKIKVTDVIVTVTEL